MLIQGVLVPSGSAALVARGLELLAAECRRDGHRLPVEAVAILEDCQTLARARRAQPAPEVPTGTSERSEQEGSRTLRSVDVATRLGCSARNVTALAQRGSLPGVFVAGRWSFDPAAVAAFEAKRAAS